MSASPHISLSVGDLTYMDEIHRGRFPLERTIPSLSYRYDRTKRFSRTPVSFIVEIMAAKPIIKRRHECPEEDVNPIATPAGWTVCVHPEGLIYYYHPVHHVVTDANLTDIEAHSKISRWIDEFYEVKKENAFELPNDFELLLELDREDEGVKYYLVDHDRERIFYFGEANTADVGLPDVYSEDHLKLQLEGQYWNHIESFPMHHPLPSSADEMIMNTLIHAWADRATSSLSTSPYSVEDCKDFIKILKTSGALGKRGYHVWVVARLLKCFIFARFINRFGEVQGARLARSQSLEATSQTCPSLLFRLISRVLFNQPRKYLDELNLLWVDNIVYAEHWQVFNVAKIEEWYGVCSMASMLLIASNAIKPTKSPQYIEVANIISNYGAAACQLLCISAITLGFKMLLVHKPFRGASICHAVEFLKNADHGKHGLQALAVVLSLPRAFLMWGLAAMIISLVSVNFEYLIAWRAVFPNTFVVCLMAIVFWAVQS